MITVLIVGAGKSSSYLIEALLKKTNSPRKNKWSIIIADSDENTLLHKTRNYPSAKIAVLDINNEVQRQKLVKESDFVISLMPPHLHILLAKDCLRFKRNLITSSYASEEMKALDTAVKEAGLTFMCEMGLDPGIDHMTASHLLNGIKKFSDIISFKSYCGGLIAPEDDNNPWHYKFSWNPRNIINAGKDGAHFLENGRKKDVGYDDMFAANKLIYCDGVGELAYYPNRDSLNYIDLYHTYEAKDFMRATLRHPDFCRGWNALIKLGVTDTTIFFNTDNMSLKDWMIRVLNYNDTSISVEEFAFRKYGIKNPVVQYMIKWLNLFSDERIGSGMKTSGDILLDILNEKWKMEPEEKDMVVMQHEVKYEYKGKPNFVTSTMVVKGENSEFSAMAKTVGLPMAILAELMIEQKIRIPKGVLIPTMTEVYRPVLLRLQKHGIIFTDTISG